jgi:hypothetical protein
MSIIVHILRGIPGSGKSTKARELTDVPDYICSADDYFVKDGVYKFLAHEIAQAHAACLKKFIGLVHRHSTVGDPSVKQPVNIVVDNTNLRKWEYESYEKICEMMWPRDTRLQFHEFVPPRDNTLGDYVRECAARNTHGVSANQCMRMASIFEMRKP